MERGRTDDILFPLASKVMHSCHNFLTATPPNVHSHHSGGAIQATFLGGFTRDIISTPRVHCPDVSKHKLK